MSDSIHWIVADNKFFLIFSMIGATSLLWHISTFDKAIISATWPTVAGKVEKAVVAEIQNANSNSDDNRKEYWPTVSYTYSVNGVEYMSNTIRYDGGLRTNMRSLVEPVVSHYLAGGDVKVFYSPQDPAKAVLETGVPKLLWLFVVMDIIFIIGGTAGYMGYIPVT
jgi:hypothetical protein